MFAATVIFPSTSILNGPFDPAVTLVLLVLTATPFKVSLVITVPCITDGPVVDAAMIANGVPTVPSLVAHI